MEAPRLRVRCLASTRVVAKGLEKEQKPGQAEWSDGRPTGEHVPQKEHEEQETDELKDSDAAEDSEDSDEDDDTASDHSSASEHGSGTAIDQPSEPRQRHVSCVQEAQLSPDGTCIFTSDYDRAFSVYLIDQDILEETGTRHLTPYARFASADPIWAFAARPQFNLNDAQTTQVLISTPNQYIGLHNALWDVSGSSSHYQQNDQPVNISTKVARYKLIDHLTEEVLAPLSLAFTRDGTHFYAGSQNQISLFDLEYTDDPVSKIRTIPSTRSKLKDGGRGYKGDIAALSLSPSSSLFRSGILAAGTRSRCVGLYDAGGKEQEITHFPLPGIQNRNKVRDESSRELMGNGVSQLKWSPCGTYLYVAERKSDVILVYDARNFSFALGHCSGRHALTPQKLGFDVWAAGDADAGHEMWAGGTDGKIRVWKDPHLKEGGLEADEVIEVGNAPVASTLVHPYGTLAVAATGCYELDGGQKGKRRADGLRPRFREWGCLDILGLGSF